MSEPIPAVDEDLRTKFNKETSKIRWHELQRFYAKGAVIAVAQGMDLIDAACVIANDDKPALEQWLDQGKVFKVDDGQAQQWFDADTLHWAVVVAPWVLVQEVSE